MSDDEDPVSSVGGSNGASWNKHRLDFISIGFDVSADAFQGKGLCESVSAKYVTRVEHSGLTLHWRNLALLDHREDASNVFANHPIGLHFVNTAVHVRPEVAVIFRASSLPGVTERLARKSASEHVDSSAPLGEVGLCDVFITFALREPIFEHLAPERIYLAVEEVLPPEHGGGDLGAAYPAEY